MIRGTYYEIILKNIDGNIQEILIGEKLIVREDLSHHTCRNKK